MKVTDDYSSHSLESVVKLLASLFHKDVGLAGNKVLRMPSFVGEELSRVKSLRKVRLAELQRLVSASYRT